MINNNVSITQLIQIAIKAFYIVVLLIISLLFLRF